jgi:hypothetical protein
MDSVFKNIAFACFFRISLKDDELFGFSKKHLTSQNIVLSTDFSHNRQSQTKISKNIKNTQNMLLALHSIIIP